LLALDTFVGVTAALYSKRLMATVFPGLNVLPFSDMLSWRLAVVVGVAVPEEVLRDPCEDVPEGALDVEETVVVGLPALEEK
jgi:hypothetical protein